MEILEQLAYKFQMRFLDKEKRIDCTIFNAEANAKIESVR